MALPKYHGRQVGQQEDTKGFKPAWGVSIPQPAMLQSVIGELQAWLLGDNNIP